MALPKKPETLDEAWDLIFMLIQRITELEAEVASLKSQLNKNSHNSSKPPSSDGLTKAKLTQSQRVKTNRKVGGQKGHIGTTLEPVENPDETIRHTPETCAHCGKSLHGVPPQATERRQQFEIPPVEVYVTEHQGDTVQCPHCGEETSATFPEGVTASISFGSRIQAMALYFLNQQLIPYDRVVELFRDCLNLPISAGTLFAIQQRCFDTLKPISEEIKQNLVGADVVNFDESGLRCEGELKWLHSAGSPTLTHYEVHAKRGLDAMRDIGILPIFNGTAIHDHWKSYFEFACGHALCNSHHLRELTFIGEEQKEDWALKMKALLQTMCHAVDVHKQSGKTAVPRAELNTLKAQYRAILAKGFAYHDPLLPLPRKGKRGKQKQRPGKNLLDRLRINEKETLLFLHDFTVPFSNNLAEQDIRMIKVKQKISGCFRTVQGAEMFCRIRGYLSTARKNGLNLLHSLQLATIKPPTLATVFA
jgi:transposase